MDQFAPRAKPSPWIAAVDNALQQLFERGLTFSQIADELCKLGHKFTRNSVIGRTHRLHFPGRPASGGKAKTAEHLRKINESRRKPFTKRAWTPAVDVTPTPSAAGAFLGLSLLELAANDCRYPQGEDSSIRFCGQPALENGPYCAAHHRLCYIRSNRQ